MSELNALGQKYHTDKADQGKRGEAGGGHNYLAVYEKYIGRDRENVKTVLEIGVQRGASVRVWQEYFPNAQIYGLDIAESALKANDERISIHLIDQSDTAALAAFAEKHGPFDLIVEDGSHFWDHQIGSLQTLLAHVKPGGHYIVEDLHTSYSADFSNGSSVPAIPYVLACCERVIAHKAGGYRPGKLDDPFIRNLIDLVESVMVMRSAAIFFRR